MTDPDPAIGLEIYDRSRLEGAMDADATAAAIEGMRRREPGLSMHQAAKAIATAILNRKAGV